MARPSQSNALTPSSVSVPRVALPPRFANQVLYHGVFAARHAWRKEVVPRPPRGEAQPKKRLSRQPVRIASSSHVPWADLLWRVFGVDGWACPRCGGEMRLRAVVLGRASTKVLTGLHATGPP